MSPKAKPAKTLVLRRPGAAKALSSPVRVEILERLQASGPASVKDLSAALGRTPHSLYYHLHRLAAVGALREESRRLGDRRDEAVYSLAAERLGLPGSPARAAAAAAATGAVLRRAARNFSRSLESGGVRAGGTRAAGSRQGRLDGEALRELEALLSRIDSVLAAANERGAGRPHLFTFAVAPLAPTPKRRRSR